MRVPVRSESDAFRITMAIGLVAGAAVVIGWLASPEYGVVVLAAGIAAGVVFELAGRDPDRGSALLDAVHDAHPHGAHAGERHVLVVASAPLAGENLRRELSAAGGSVALDVLAPVLASRAHHWASDIDHEREQARRRLEASLAWAAAQGFAANGQVGDSDPLAAIEDELRDFGADEVIIVTHAGERRSWLADRMLTHLSRELDVPVREVLVDEGDGHPAGSTADEAS